MAQDSHRCGAFPVHSMHMVKAPLRKDRYDPLVRRLILDDDVYPPVMTNKTEILPSLWNHIRIPLGQDWDQCEANSSRALRRFKQMARGINQSAMNGMMLTQDL